MDFLPDDKTMCHHTAFEKSCRSIVTGCGCRKWVKVDGLNPNTGEQITKFDCADAWLPMLIIENTQMQRQTGAAVESFRNETIKGNEQAMRVMVATALPRHNGTVLTLEDQSDG